MEIEQLRYLDLTGVPVKDPDSGSFCPPVDQLCDSEQGLPLSGPLWRHGDCLLRILSTQSKHMWPQHIEGSPGLRCCRGSSPGGRGWGPGASVIGQAREGSGTLPLLRAHLDSYLLLE